jgi:radical SAM protein with 4Fe4S-binding SPASM domain
MILFIVKQPSNIDFLNVGNQCNQRCRQCFYNENGEISNLTLEQEIELIGKVAKNFPDSAIFVYPKEITTSLDIIPTLAKNRQTSTLSNGRDLDDIVIAKLRNFGIEEIGITLFANAEQQLYFNGNSREEYLRIKDAIQRAISQGLKVTVNTVLAKATMGSIEELCLECSKLGVLKIRFYRLMPIGNAKDMGSEQFLVESDMDSIIGSVESMKKKFPTLYLSFAINFGPNFYGKSIEEARKKVQKSNQSWTKSPYLCPSIGQNYFGISLKSGSIYWCFFLISEPGISRIGYIDPKTSKITIDSPVDLSPETLRTKLNGNCSSKNCDYQALCLGGCRAAAYLFAKRNGVLDPLYAGMDICLTRSYQRFFEKNMGAARM